MCLSSTLQNTLSNLISNYHSSISQYTIQTPLISVLQLNINASNTSISYLTNPYNLTSLINPVLLLSLIIQQVTNNTNHHYSYSIPFYIISYHHTILTILKANYTNKRTISLPYFNYLIQYHIIITYTSSILNISCSLCISGHPTQLS